VVLQNGWENKVLNKNTRFSAPIKFWIIESNDRIFRIWLWLLLKFTIPVRGSHCDYFLQVLKSLATPLHAGVTFTYKLSVRFSYFTANCLRGDNSQVPNCPDE
jgi:hypothetical protein